jgi:hypothetical protein
MQMGVGKVVLVDGTVRARIVGTGDPDDAVELTVGDATVLRDVAIVEYLEGERKGFTDQVPYHRLSPGPE